LRKFFGYEACGLIMVNSRSGEIYTVEKGVMLHNMGSEADDWKALP
jgi:hypothetical protein